MVGRKPSADPSSQMAIYPSRSLRFRLEAEAAKKGVKVATYIVEAAREKLERDEAGASPPKP